MMSSGFHKYFEYLTTHLTSPPQFYTCTQLVVTTVSWWLFWPTAFTGDALRVIYWNMYNLPVATLLKKKMLFLSLAAIYWQHISGQCGTSWAPSFFQDRTVNDLILCKYCCHGSWLQRPCYIQKIALHTLSSSLIFFIPPIPQCS